jgi:transcription elongation factor Elf1
MEKIIMSNPSRFPCPLCNVTLDVRKSVKGKPYVVCDPCGMQMFLRKDEGIAALHKISSGGSADKLREKIQSLEKQLALAERNKAELTRKTVKDIEKSALRTCPECGAEFIIREDLIKTSWLDGRFLGFKCPKDGCKGIALRQSEEN